MQNAIEKILAIETSNKEVRIQSAFELMNIATRDALDALIQAMLKDPSPNVRHECAFALGETADTYVVPALLKAMQEDDCILVIHEAALALGTIGDMRAEEPLNELLKHEDPLLSESAEIALIRLKTVHESQSEN